MWALFVIFGAALRWWDGTRGDIGPVHVPGGVRSAMLAGACLLAAGWSFGFGIGTGIPWIGLWAAAVAGYSIVTGRTDWPRWQHRYCCLAEAPSWSDWWPNNTTVEPRYWVRMLKLSLRGCLLLNPLMGPIDFLIHELPIRGDKRAYGELVSGAVTAASYLFVLLTIPEIWGLYP